MLLAAVSQARERLPVDKTAERAWPHLRSVASTASSTLGYRTLAVYKRLLGGIQDPRPKKVGHRDTGPSQCLSYLGRKNRTHAPKGRTPGYKTHAVSKSHHWGDTGPASQTFEHRDNGPTRCLMAEVGGYKIRAPQSDRDGTQTPHRQGRNPNTASEAGKTPGY